MATSFSAKALSAGVALDGPKIIDGNRERERERGDTAIGDDLSIARSVSVNLPTPIGFKLKGFNVFTRHVSAGILANTFPGETGCASASRTFSLLSSTEQGGSRRGMHAAGSEKMKIMKSSRGCRAA